MTDTKRPMTFMKRAWWHGARSALRVVRVAVGGTVVLTALGLVATRVSIAGAADAGMHFSDQLLMMGEQHLSGDFPGDVYTMEVNGQQFQSTNAITPRSMDEVLTYFQDQCRHHAGGLRDTFGHMRASLETLEPAEGVAGNLVVRRDDEDRGYVFCVAPDHELSQKEILHRLRVASKTSDLHMVGDVRYVAVRKAGTGTQMVSLWTEGPLRLNDMLAMTGDARGEDFGGVPRPVGSRRTFSGSIQGVPFGLSAYEAPGSVATVLHGLDTNLSSLGWVAQSGGPRTPDTARFYSFGTTMDLIVSTAPAGKDLTRVTYVVSRNVGGISR